MKRLQGMPVGGGIAIGDIHYILRKEKLISHDEVADTKAESERFEEAKSIVLMQLGELYEKSVGEVGAEHAALFEAQSMILEDGQFCESILSEIQNYKRAAEYAVSKTGEVYVNRFLTMEDEYIRARAADIKAVTDRVLHALQGTQRAVHLGDEPVVLAADDLTPGELIGLDKSKLLALALKEGDANSHVAILARIMNIPALMGIDVSPDWNGKMAIVDGYEGVLYLEPDEKTLEQKRARQKIEKEKRDRWERLKDLETVTTDGQKVGLYANISGLKEVESVLENSGEGIGLFRSEFLYMEKDHWPTEEEQFAVYKTVAEKMNGKKVIIRTFDLGADKTTDYFKPETEKDPAIGLRGIRLALELPETFKTQLRALYRASVFGNIAIMFPMISSLEEVCKVKRIVAEVKEELSDLNVAYKEVELGVMIETPAAVMISEELAREVDFFSIGTNDLMRYTLALERQNQRSDCFNGGHYPAVLGMVQMTIENAHKHGTRVGICGELGADMTLTEQFLKMGIDELSVSPTCILPIRGVIRKMSVR